MFKTMLWDIEQSLENFRRSFERMLSGFDGYNRRLISTGDGSDWAFTPAVETAWTDNAMHLRFVVPGVSEKDLKVTVQGNTLTVQGERKAPEYVEEGESLYSGLIYGKFVRSLDLPNGVDLDKLEARLHDGVLDIRVPVKAEMKPKQIPISAGESRKAIAA